MDWWPRSPENHDCVRFDVTETTGAARWIIDRQKVVWEMRMPESGLWISGRFFLLCDGILFI